MYIIDYGIHLIVNICSYGVYIRCIHSDIYGFTYLQYIQLRCIHKMYTFRYIYGYMYRQFTQLHASSPLYIDKIYSYMHAIYIENIYSYICTLYILTIHIAICKLPSHFSIAAMYTYDVYIQIYIAIHIDNTRSYLQAPLAYIDIYVYIFIHMYTYIFQSLGKVHVCFTYILTNNRVLSACID